MLSELELPFAEAQRVETSLQTVTFLPEGPHIGSLM